MIVIFSKTYASFLELEANIRSMIRRMCRTGVARQARKRPWGNWKTIKNSCFVASQRRFYWVAGDKRNYQKAASSISERAFGGIPTWITGGVLCAVCVVGSAPRLKTEDWILPIQKHAAAAGNPTPDTLSNQSQHQPISHTTQHTRVKQNSLCFLQKGTQPSQTCSWGHMTHHAKPDPKSMRVMPLCVWGI